MDIVDSLQQFFVRAGAGWVMWLLFALLAAAFVVAIERLVYFLGRSDDVHGLVSTLDAHLGAGDVDAALRELSRQRSLGAAVAAAGLRLAPRGATAAEKAMASAMAFERKRLEVRLAFLGTLGNNAPFVGLFGTVIGVILAFDELGRAGQVVGTSAGQIASDALMAAIAESLVATAVGIAVALPAVAMYNAFQRWISALMADAEALSNLVVAYVGSEPSAPAGTDAGGHGS